MGVNANYQLNQLNEMANNLDDIRRFLKTYQDNLQTNWKATEMVHINGGINQIENEIQSLLASLRELGHSISAAVDDINREEQLRLEAERKLAEQRLAEQKLAEQKRLSNNRYSCLDVKFQ